MKKKKKLAGYRCPYCESPNLREKMYVLVCNSCGKCFSRANAHRDERPPEPIYKEERPQ